MCANNYCCAIRWQIGPIKTILAIFKWIWSELLLVKKSIRKLTLNLANGSPSVISKIFSHCISGVGTLKPHWTTHKKNILLYCIWSTTRVQMNAFKGSSLKWRSDLKEEINVTVPFACQYWNIYICDSFLLYIFVINKNTKTTENCSLIYQTFDLRNEGHCDEDKETEFCHFIRKACSLAYSRFFSPET